jgi:hypothetical protein
VQIISILPFSSPDFLLIISLDFPEGKCSNQWQLQLVRASMRTSYQVVRHSVRL